DQVELGAVSELKQKDAILMLVETKKPFLWRVNAFNHYNGVQWSKRGSRPAEIKMEGNRVKLKPLYFRKELFVKLPADKFYNHKFYINNYAQDFVVGAYPVLEVNDIKVSQVKIDHFENIYLGRPLKSGDYYEIVSIDKTYPSDYLRSLPRQYPQEIIDLYLQLPENFGREIMDLTEKILKNIPSNIYDEVVAIRNYLTKNCKYSITNKDKAPTLKEFLLDKKDGDCEYFATAMALMLRFRNIPSRLVIGFSGGDYDESRMTSIIYARHAHAWVEVFFPTIGWIPCEATPRALSQAQWEDSPKVLVLRPDPLRKDSSQDTPGIAQDSSQDEPKAPEKEISKEGSAQEELLPGDYYFKDRLSKQEWPKEEMIFSQDFFKEDSAADVEEKQADSGLVQPQEQIDTGKVLFEDSQAKEQELLAQEKLSEGMAPEEKELFYKEQAQPYPAEKDAVIQDVPIEEEQVEVFEDVVLAEEKEQLKEDIGPEAEKFSKEDTALFSSDIKPQEDILDAQIADIDELEEFKKDEAFTQQDAAGVPEPDFEQQDELIEDVIAKAPLTAAEPVKDEAFTQQDAAGVPEPDFEQQDERAEDLPDKAPLTAVEPVKEDEKVGDVLEQDTGTGEQELEKPVLPEQYAEDKKDLPSADISAEQEGLSAKTQDEEKLLSSLEKEIQDTEPSGEDILKPDEEKDVLAESQAIQAGIPLQDEVIPVDEKTDDLLQLDEAGLGLEEAVPAVVVKKDDIEDTSVSEKKFSDEKDIGFSDTTEEYADIAEQGISEDFDPETSSDLDQDVESDFVLDDDLSQEEISEGQLATDLKAEDLKQLVSGMQDMQEEDVVAEDAQKISKIDDVPFAFEDEVAAGLKDDGTAKDTDIKPEEVLTEDRFLEKSLSLDEDLEGLVPDDLKLAKEQDVLDSQETALEGVLAIEELPDQDIDLLLQWLRDKLKEFVFNFSYYTQRTVVRFIKSILIGVKDFVSNVALNLMEHFKQQRRFYGPVLAVLVLSLLAWNMVKDFIKKRRERSKILKLFSRKVLTKEEIRITNFYLRALELLSKAGYKRLPNLTPREFSRNLVSKGIRIAKDFSYLTEMFYRISFGKIALEPFELKRVNEISDSIKEWVRESR
ncbi:MAG: transglutaminase domain-containing protein, partial [Candidatus Omnitrophica bacterium]|nr:transglutaminase domain-containing protein [Candidatus Omnitrophota bacterium]